MVKNSSLIPHGDRTVSKICGNKWPRLLSLRVAAYVNRSSVSSFKSVPEFTGLIRNILGQECVDRAELDELITKIVESQKQTVNSATTKRH